MSLSSKDLAGLGDGDAGSLELSLGRVEQKTTPDTVASLLRQAILNGTLKPGSQIREIPVAAALGVSRAPLREGLALLVDEGLVVRIPYKGAFVAEVSQETVAEIASLRRRLEPYAIELAMPKLTGPGRTKVVSALQAMAKAADAGDMARTIDAHMDFHRRFYELAGHKLLLDLWRSWESQLQLFLSVDHRSFADLHDVVAEHERLLSIIDSGDMDAISREIDRHVHGPVVDRPHDRDA